MKRSMHAIPIGLGIAFLSPVFGKQQPNIVFIMSDDHAYQAISAYGSSLNQTPNIDRIADEGVLFRNAFVTNSISAPSRAVMLTGKFNHINGKIDNQKSVFDWNQPSFVKLLRENGYATALIGKIHIPGNPEGFDYTNILPGQGRYYNPVFIENGVRKSHQGYVTTLTTEFALNWLDQIRDKEKPFCLLYHQKAPHRNWKPEQKYLTLFDDREFDVPDNFFDDYEGRGSAAKMQKMEIGRDMSWGHDMKFETDPFSGELTGFGKDIQARFSASQLEAWRNAYNPKNALFRTNPPEGKELYEWKYNRYIKDYLRCIQSVDDGVGEVLDYLEEHGLSDNTIVVYTSDQGFYLGEHGWFDKRFMYEESLRMPLLVKYPKEINPGTVCHDLVQNIDFAPTLLEYAGVPVPNDMQGESFGDVLKGDQKNWRDAIYYHYYEYPGPHHVIPHYGVRTERYKLMHFYGVVDEWELYDLEADPSEMRNVYDHPEYVSIRNMMHKKLKELQQQYQDENPENPLN